MTISEISFIIAGYVFRVVFIPQKRVTGILYVHTGICAAFVRGVDAVKVG